MRSVLALILVAGCGAKASTPSPTAAAPHPRPLPDNDDDLQFTVDDEFADFVDADCVEGPGANIFLARYENYEHEDVEQEPVGPGLYTDACDSDAEGPAQVITVDGHLLDATASIEGELEATYRIDAPGYARPADDDLGGVVIIPAVRGARAVTVPSEDLVAIGDAVQRDFDLAYVPPIPTGIVGVDLDRDGRCEAALVTICFQMNAGHCTDSRDRFVHRLDSGWSVPRVYGL